MESIIVIKEIVEEASDRGPQIRERTVYEQKVKDLDVNAVIAVVNGLVKPEAKEAKKP